MLMLLPGTKTKLNFSHFNAARQQCTYNVPKVTSLIASSLLHPSIRAYVFIGEYLFLSFLIHWLSNCGPNNLQYIIRMDHVKTVKKKMYRICTHGDYLSFGPIKSSRIKFIFFKTKVSPYQSWNDTKAKTLNISQ